MKNYVAERRQREAFLESSSAFIFSQLPVELAERHIRVEVEGVWRRPGASIATVGVAWEVESGWDPETASYLHCERKTRTFEVNLEGPGRGLNEAIEIASAIRTSRPK